MHKQPTPGGSRPCADAATPGFRESFPRASEECPYTSAVPTPRDGGRGQPGAEIVERTEQYFCPIKHARKILGTHARYARFLDYGEAADYEAKLEAFRIALDKRK
jgi:hypothetical protein